MSADSTIRLEKVIKRLEESALRGGEDGIMSGSDGNPAKIPAHVRDIITKHLTHPEVRRTSLMGEGVVPDLLEENRMLSAELARVEEMLSSSRAERDELGIKYNALSERFEQSLKVLGSDVDDVTPRSSLRHNIDLRRTFEEEQCPFTGKLQAYHEGQQRQAQLVQNLQAEDQASRHLLRGPEYRLKMLEDERAADHETALIKLDEEQQRSNSLSQINALMGEQLDQATGVNEQLTIDIQKLTSDWQQAREEMEAKEHDWRKEEESFNDYCSAEHERFLSLSREMVDFRRLFSEMKAATEKELTCVRTDVANATRKMQSSCLNFNVDEQDGKMQDQVDHRQRKMPDYQNLESRLESRNRDLLNQQARNDALSSELGNRINDLSIQNDELTLLLSDRERDIAALKKKLSELQSHCERKDTDITNQDLDETEVIQSALRKMAEAVINDTEQNGIEGTLAEDGIMLQQPLSSYRSRSGYPTSRRKSPSRSLSPRYRSRSPALADATFSVVQAALGKRLRQVLDLRSKLNVLQDNVCTLRKTLDDAENEKRFLEHVVVNLKEDVEIARREKIDSHRDQERIQNTLNDTGTEKSQLERIRLELNTQIELLHKEIAKLQTANNEMQRQRDHLADIKNDVEQDKMRHIRENERCQGVVNQLEEKLSRVKEKYHSTKESLCCSSLDRDVLEGQKKKIGDALSAVEASKAKLEVEVNEVKIRGNMLNDELSSCRDTNERLGQDKSELNKMIIELESVRSELCDKKSVLELEKEGLREQLLRMEQDKIEQDTEKRGLNQTLQLSEVACRQLEEDIRSLNRDKLGVDSQLAVTLRQKQALTEDLLTLRHDLERSDNAYERVVNEKETITLEKGELVVQVTGTELDNRGLGEMVAALESEKSQLENALFDAQQTISGLETRQNLLVDEKEGLIARKENLLGEIIQLEKEKQGNQNRFDIQRSKLNDQMIQLEEESQMMLAKEKEAHKEECNRLISAQKNLRLEFNTCRDELIHVNDLEKADMAERAERQFEEVKANLAKLKNDRDEALMLAEVDKQQAILLFEHEKSTLSEKLASARMDVTDLANKYDCSRSEAQKQDESQRITIISLQGDVKNVQRQLEQKTVDHETEIHYLTDQVREIARQREIYYGELIELKSQLGVVEDSRDAIRRDLLQANRKLREGAEVHDVLKKQFIDTKRALSDEVRENEGATTMADILRSKVKICEQDKSDLAGLVHDATTRIGVLEQQKNGISKENEDLRSSWKSGEKSRLEAETELQNLQRQTNALRSERLKLGTDVTHLQHRVARDKERWQECCRSMLELKEKFVVSESSKEALNIELSNLQLKMANLLDDASVKEKDLQGALDEVKSSNRRVEDQRREHTVTMEACNGAIRDMRMKVSAADGRVKGLETTLSRTEAGKRDVEFKLTSIVSCLRRMIGFRQSTKCDSLHGFRRSRSASPHKGLSNTHATAWFNKHGGSIPRDGPPNRSGSPQPSHSPYRFGTPPRRKECIDVDPEAVRTALRDFTTQLINVERERDKASATVCILGNKVKDLEEEVVRTNNQLSMQQKTLGVAEHDRRGVDSRLSATQSAIMLQEETIRSKDRERNDLHDRVKALGCSLTTVESEKRQLEEKLQKEKQSQLRLQAETKELHCALENANDHCCKLELNLTSVGGELHRTKLAAKGKESDNHERSQGLVKQVGLEESKYRSLQLSVDRLNSSQAKNDEEMLAAKNRVEALNLSLSDRNAIVLDLEERLIQCQRSLRSSEQDRCVLHEKLDIARNAVSESKKQHNELMERLQSVQSDMADTEIRFSELSGHKRQLNNMLLQRQETEQDLNQQVQKCRTEKQVLVERVSSLSRTLTSMDTEKLEAERSSHRLEKDKNALMKTLDKVEREKLRTEEIATKTLYNRGNFDRGLHRFEEEKLELQRSLQQMQTQLLEAEQRHAQRLVDVNERHRAETQMETARLKSTQARTENLLEDRERVHGQKVKDLEEQVSTLRSQIVREDQRRQQYLNKSASAGSAISHMRSTLDKSLSVVGLNTNLDGPLLERETRKLDQKMNSGRCCAVDRRTKCLAGHSASPVHVRFSSMPSYMPTVDPLRRKLRL